MGAFLISYHSPQPGEERVRLLDTIRHYPAAQLSDNAFVIHTSESAEQVYAKLEPWMGGDGSLYVMGVSGPWKGCGPHYVQKLFGDWLPATGPQ